MKTKHILIGLAFSAVVLSSCENDPYEWEGSAYARIVGPENWTLETDSMAFTFSRLSTDITSYVVDAEIKLIGIAADVDRTVVVALDSDATTATPAMYSFDTVVVIKAGEISGAFPITLNREASLATSSARLKIVITDNGDIKSGVSAWNQLSIKFSDMIEKPTNWDEYLSPFFGVYSEVKYRFIISTTGIVEFTYGQEGGMTWGEMWNYQLVMKAALDEYNSTHDTPLTDEKNRLVTF